jgi:sterol 3beta-glucosyltransferase
VVKGGHVTLLTYGSRGDVEPFVALGVGLSRAGHGVRLVAPAVFQEFANAHGLGFAGLPGDPDQLVQGLVAEAGQRWWRMVRVMSRHVLPLAAEVMAAVRAACRETEACRGRRVIVHSFLMTQAGYQVARELDVPDVSAQFFPVFASTTAFPGVVFPDLPLGGAYRRLTHAVVTQTFHRGGRLLYRRVRRDHPDLPALVGWPFDGRGPRWTPILFAFSPSVVARPHDWGPDVHVTGYWFLEPEAGWEPPPALSRFLEAGPPPVYVGFGSIVARDSRELAEIALQALARAGQRGVLSPGRAGLEVADLPGDVYLLETAPHAWLFPRMAAVVHHGGAGTVGAGLRAGVPNVVVPFTSDQPFWGRRVTALGAGPEPIPARRLTADALASAIARAAGDEAMRARAQALGERLRSEDGVGRAIALLQGYLL